MADANGLRFWMLSEAKQWNLLGDPAGVQYDRDRRSLRLASQRRLPPWQIEALSETATPSPVTGPESRTEARSRLSRIPETRDSFGTRAYWDGDSQRVVATGAAPGVVGIYLPPIGDVPTDLAMGYDGVLYLAIAGRIVMLDRRQRWQPVTLTLEGFTAWRLAADPAGGVWVLDQNILNPAQRQIARVQGLPFPDRPYSPYDSGTFRPCEENPNPPRLTRIWAGSWAGEEPVAIACSPQGQLALLTWVEAADAQIRLWDQDHWKEPIRLQGARYPYSLTWVAPDRIAVLLYWLTTEAPVYPTVTTGTVLPVGDFYPLRNHRGGPFLHGVDLPAHYPTETGSEPLHHLSLPAFAERGTAIAQQAFNSGSAQTVWHRLYLEAAIPAHCGIRVFLAASDEQALEDGVAVPPEEVTWYEHRVGEKFAVGDRTLPVAAWVPQPSEIPFHPGLLTCEPEPNRAGLFTVLIQRAERRVRSLEGQYLWVRVELSGDGRTSPELTALRVYGSRFSYLNQYLPALYRETEFGPDADQAGQSTRADFLERFLDNFEGILTPLEDRIANSYLLTDPQTAPTEALDWLATWIGVSFEAGYPAERRRLLLREAPTLYRQRGTLAGLRRSLDIATGGAVSGGELVVLEDFRLRRTFATILGANLANPEDPLLQGLSISGNSFVGDTLVLGDETRQEFLALFNAQQLTEAENEDILEFFDQLAHRVTVLVHEAIAPQDLGLIRRIVELETPAHVLSRVVTARHPFVVSLASLVGIDTYLSQKPQSQPVRVEQSQLGVRDLIQRPASLDPRLEGGGPDLRRPIAGPGSEIEAEFGVSFELDGSDSNAFGGAIARYIWTQLE